MRRNFAGTSFGGLALGVLNVKERESHQITPKSEKAKDFSLEYATRVTNQRGLV